MEDKATERRGPNPAKAQSVIGLTMVAAMAAASALLGCGKDSGGGGYNANGNQQLHCPEGTRAEGFACVPILDDCSAVPDEVPALGGGCTPVGVARCPLGAGCAAGFASDGAGGCDPVRPAAECGAGTMQVLGVSDCVPVQPCGAAPWGDGPFDADAVYVDASYSGGSSDGSAAAPFTTLGAALAVVPDGGQVVLAEGTYNESVVIDRRVRILGRCPERVHLVGQTSGGQPAAALTVSRGAAGTRIEGVHVTGPGPGIVLNEVADVRIRGVEVSDTGSYGVMLQRGATGAMRHVKVARAAVAGVLLYGGALTAVETVVRDTAPSPDGSYGRGIDLGCDHFGQGGCPTLDATGLVVERNHEAGVLLAGGAATLRGSLVADTLANAGHGQAGIGIQSQCDTTSADCPVLTVTGSVIQGNRAAGIMALGTALTVTDTVVRDTRSQDADGRFGSGIVAQCDPSLSRCEPAAATCITLQDNHQTGMTFSGVPATVDAALVVRTAAQQSDLTGGYGLVVDCDPVTRGCADVTLTDARVEASVYGGVFAHGARLAASGLFLYDTQPGAAAGAEGFGLQAKCHSATGACPEVQLDGSLVQESLTEGIAIFGGAAQLTRSAIRGVGPQQSDGEFGVGAYVDGQIAVVAPTLDASSSEIRDATLAGVFWVEAGGSIARCLVAGADYSIILHQSEDLVDVDPWNELSGATQSEPLIQ